MRPYSANRTLVKWGATPILSAAALLMGCEHAGQQTALTAPPSVRGPRADVVAQTTDWLTRALLGLDQLVTDPASALVQPEDPPDDPITVVPFEFDPNHTSLVRAFWMRGIGCPTHATAVDFFGASEDVTDPACTTGDPKDSPGKNKGLLLVKTGPSVPNFASAGAVLNGVKGIMLTELGYDIRKPAPLTADATDPRGSHCGAGAPRFNVSTTDGFFFIGCNSPPATTASGGPLGAWQRLRWGPGPGPIPCVPGFKTPTFVLVCITGAVQSITIIFDEGTDPSGGPDTFGLAVLDNIDVNGTLVGRGPGN
jgi:hypothetical protein